MVRIIKTWLIRRFIDNNSESYHISQLNNGHGRKIGLLQEVEGGIEIAIRRKYPEFALSEAMIHFYNHDNPGQKYPPEAWILNEEGELQHTFVCGEEKTNQKAK